MRLYKATLILLTFSLIINSSCKSKMLDVPVLEKTKSTYLNELSEDFLYRIIRGQETQDIQNQLAKISMGEIAQTLINDDQRLAFWINIYNAYIQVILLEHPEYYKNRNKFFSQKQILIGGDQISFSFIEHGIIRRSQWLYGLGYIGKMFPSKMEKSLRVDQKNFRVHFALNCGAKDCPPVAIYTATRINEQLQLATESFLKNTTDYDSANHQAHVTPLFSWFRGDFGGKSGIKSILKENGIIDTTKGITLKFKDYDWTLNLDNYVEL